MAEDQTVTSDVAVADPPGQIIPPVAIDPPAKPGKTAKKSKDDEELEYEVEFETPFGKIEFELEPNSSKERKDRERKEKADRDAAKVAAKAAKKAQQLLSKGKPEQQLVAKGGGSKLVPFLLIFLLVAGAVAVAVWLFARPGEDEDAIPPEFRGTDDNVIPEPAPQGFVAKAQHRIRDAVHAGRHASRDAQREQEQRFQDLTSKK